MPAQQRLEDVVGWGTGLKQELQLPLHRLHNTFPVPESLPRAPGEWQQEADWKSQLAASCAHRCCQNNPQEAA